MKPPIINPNRKPADDLADVRSEIRALKEKEDYLRRKILSGDFDTAGDEYTVVLKTASQVTFNRKAAEEELGDALDKFKSKKEITRLTLVANDD